MSKYSTFGDGTGSNMTQSNKKRIF